MYSLLIRPFLLCVLLLLNKRYFWITGLFILEIQRQWLWIKQYGAKGESISFYNQSR